MDRERFHARRREREGAALLVRLGLDPSDCVLPFPGAGCGRTGLDQVPAACPEVFAREPRARGRS